MNDHIFSQNRNILNDLITENNDIGIVVGEQHSLDKIAASLSLFLSLKTIGKNVQIISIKEPIVEFSNLVGIDKIKKEFSGSLKTLTISFPYDEGEIEKVSYNIENSRLNINLFSGDRDITFTDKDVQYIKKGAAPSLIFSIGASDENKLYNLFDANENIKIVNIDNNLENSGYGDVSYTSSSFSSLSEIVAEIISDLSLPIDIDIAQNLMDGISDATSNFTSFSTSPFAFEATSFLLKNGAKRRFTNDNLSKRKSFQEESRPQVRVTEPRQENRQQEKNMIKKEETDKNREEPDRIPKDWFTPKVFKGSSGQDEDQ